MWSKTSYNREHVGCHDCDVQTCEAVCYEAQNLNETESETFFQIVSGKRITINSSPVAVVVVDVVVTVAVVVVVVSSPYN